MNTLTAQLADALRALFDSPREGQMGEGTKLLCGELKLDEARLALAAYDAQQHLIAASGTAPDTVQKIAGDVLALAALLHDPSPEKKRLRAIAERLTALSAHDAQQAYGHHRYQSQQPMFTTGHCERHKQAGGCPLHNLHCGWPECDRRPV